MDGYSVDEAAAVLGIPQGRVWELLARGVLAGSSGAGGEMRVILKAPAPPAAEIPPANGGPRPTNGGELSAFRELLTEFRNLTERYGQALLALGEARGEVAALNARVTVMESRLDLRLPGGEAGPVAAWQSAPESIPSAPHPAEAVREIAAELPVEVAAEARPAPVRRERPPRMVRGTPTRSRSAPKRRPAPRTGGSRAAVAHLAEAMARADDPSASPLTEREALPGAREAAAALAAFRADVEAPPPAPMELAMPAPPVVVEMPTRAIAVPVGYETAFEEPDWIAEEDLAPVVREEPVTASEVEDVAEGSAVWAPTEADAVPFTIAPEPLGQPDPFASREPSVAPEPVAAGRVDPWVTPAAMAAASAPPAPAPDEVELMWLGEEFSTAPTAPETDAWDAAEVEALRMAYRAEPEPSAPPPPATAGPPPATPTRPESQDWVRGRSGPAARAYRRLRRIVRG